MVGVWPLSPVPGRSRLPSVSGAQFGFRYHKWSLNGAGRHPGDLETRVRSMAAMGTVGHAFKEA